MQYNITGNGNTACGSFTLFQLTSGLYNIAVGYQAGNNFSGSESSNIDIGNLGVPGDNNIIRIGSSQTQAFIAGQIVGDGSGLTNMQVGQLPAAVVTNNATGLSLTGTFNGNGGGLTNLNAATLTGTAANFSAGSLTVSSNLYLPATTATNGIIYSGGNTLIHAYGTRNFFAGTSAGNLTLTGNNNTANGFDALRYNTNGSDNTAHGAYALQNNTTGYRNTAIGSGVMSLNTTGYQNTAIGYDALSSNTNGTDNTAVGAGALLSNSSGNYNTALGENTLYFNTIGSNNTAVGFSALRTNSIGTDNTAYGHDSMQYNITGNGNTACGSFTLFKLTSGQYNIAVGYQAGNNFSGLESSNIDIGNLGLTGDNNIIRIGSSQTQAFIAGQIVGDGSGLTNLSAKAISGGVTTNILTSSSGGYTLFITNGIIMKVQ